MYQKLITIIIVLCLAMTGCGSKGVNGDKQAVEAAAQALISAYNSGNTEEAYKLLSPTYSEFKSTGVELFSAPDLVPETPAAVSPQGPPPAADPSEDQPQTAAKWNLKLDSYNIRLYNGSAMLTGYIGGDITGPAGEREEGPWRASVFFVKTDGKWLIESIHMSELKTQKLDYLVQLPKNYDPKEQKKWPLLIFLHGMESRGSDLDLVKQRVLPKLAESKEDFPFILVSPQCPADSVWDDHIVALNNVLDEVIGKYNVDTDRVYLTGMSLGGHGTWAFAMSYPERFAAIAPVCGWADPTKVDRIKDMPVWAFHGDKDDMVPISCEQKAVDALKGIGGDVKFTVYQGVDHNAWDPTYNNEELYTWFLQHTKGKK